MKKLITKRASLIILALILTIGIVLSVIACVETTVAKAFVLPHEQILPGDIGSDQVVFEKKGEVVSAIDKNKYVVYRGNHLRPSSIEIESSQRHYFDASKGKNLTFFYEKEANTSYSIGAEISASLGVSVGADAFGISATVETEVTSTLGISTSVGKGYTENLTYTLSPNSNVTGKYYVATNAFVRDYKVMSYEWKKVQTGTKTVRLWYTLWIGTKQEPVYENKWVESGTKYTCFPESYYYTLERLGK